MKVFVYEKRGSKKILEIEDAIMVIEKKRQKEIKIYAHDNEFRFDTRKYKTVTYQN